MKIYTKKGDDGTTGLLYGGRVSKNSPQVELNGAVDEAQAFMGLARSSCARGDELDRILVNLESDLWILMAEVATEPNNRSKLISGQSLINDEMISNLESLIDEVTEKFDFPNQFAVPGQNQLSAALDVARTVIRRAERLSVPYVADNPESLVGRYLNRLSDLVWTLARWQEDEHLTSKEVKRSNAD